jgi:hypothetical protein
MPIVTLIDDGHPAEVEALADGDALRISAAEVERVLGWELKPEGLCRDDICIPVPPGAISATRGIDLRQLADLLGRPLVVDQAERTAALGASSLERRAMLSSLTAPDFILPDLEGHMHSLSDHLGTKVFMVAWASW